MPSKIENEYIKNLQNFTGALENLVDLLKKQHDKGGDALNNMSAAMDGDKIKTIAEDVKALVQTTGRIDDRTKEILTEVKAARKAKEGGVFSKTSDKDNKKKVVDGVKLIILIAAGVLAIGMAFKIIGKVDPLSVISLSIAIYIIATVFEKLGNIKGMSTKKAITISGIMVLMSLGIMLSSQLLRWVAPISLITAFSIITVSVALGLATFLLFKAVEKLDLTKPKVLKNLLLLPLILPIIATAIVLSSFILALTQTITLKQALSALAISAILGVAAYLLLKGLNGQDLSNPQTIKSILLLPLILPIIALSIALSSFFLKLTQPLSEKQGISALVIGALLGTMSYLLLKGLKGLDLSDPKMMKNIFLLPLLIPAIMLAVVISSFVLKLFQPIKNVDDLQKGGLAISIITVIFSGLAILISKMGVSASNVLVAGLIVIGASISLVAASYVLNYFKPLKTDSKTFTDNVISMGLGVLVFLPIILLISKFNVKASDVLVAGLAIILIAGAIAATSLILNLGKYELVPSTDWVIGAGLSLLVFGIFTAALGALIMSGVGAAGVALGALAIPLIAWTIKATANILNGGKYTSYPPLEWSKSVGLSLLAFIPSMIIAGVGVVAIALGALAMLLVAKTIVSVASILSSGKYIGGPSLEWAASTALIIPVFTAAMIALGAVGLLGGPLLLLGGGLLLTVSKAIVESSKILSGGVYTGGPTKTWAEGVALSIGAFSTALSVAMDSGKSLIDKIFGGGGITPEQFVVFIQTVSSGIVSAAGLFNGVTSWGKGPDKIWAEGVGTAIGAFSQALVAVSNSGSWYDSAMTGEDFVKFIKSVSGGIVAAAGIFSGVKVWGKGPDKTWAEGVGTAISSFTNALQIADQIGMDGDELTKFISNIARNMKYLSDTFVLSNFSVYPTQPWVDGLNYTFTAFKNLKGINEDDINMVYYFSKYLAKTSEKFSSVAWDIYPKKEWISALDSLSKVVVYIGKNIDEKKIDALNNFADAVKNVSNSFADLNQSGIDKLSNLSANITLLSVVDTNRLDMVVKSLDTNKGLIQNAVSSIVNKQQQQPTNTFDSMKSLFDALVPTNKKSNDASKITSDKSTSKAEPLKVDHKDITDRMDSMLKKMDEMIIAMGGSPQKTGDLSKHDNVNK